MTPLQSYLPYLTHFLNSFLILYSFTCCVHLFFSLPLPHTTNLLQLICLVIQHFHLSPTSTTFPTVYSSHSCLQLHSNPNQAGLSWTRTSKKLDQYWFWPFGISSVRDLTLCNLLNETPLVLVEHRLMTGHHLNLNCLPLLGLIGSEWCLSNSSLP